MKITVKLFATFRQGRFKIEDRDVPAGARVLDVLHSLDIDPADVGTLFVKGRAVEVDRVLEEGEAIAIFPLVGGG